MKAKITSHGYAYTTTAYWGEITDESGKRWKFDLCIDADDKPYDYSVLWRNDKDGLELETKSVQGDNPIYKEIMNAYNEMDYSYDFGKETD